MTMTIIIIITVPHRVGAFDASSAAQCISSENHCARCQRTGCQLWRSRGCPHVEEGMIGSGQE